MNLEQCGIVPNSYIKKNRYKKEDIYKGCYIKRGEGQREKNISYTYSADHLKGEN